MGGDQVRAVRIVSGVYQVSVGEPPVDGLVVDRSRAVAEWLAVADVVVTSGPGEDVDLLVELAARLYHGHVTAGVSVARHRPSGST